MKKNTQKNLLKNERGQFVIEAVLLMVVSIGFLYAGLRLLKNGDVLGNLVASPWERVAGMIESGSWTVADQAAKTHPNQIDRSLSLDPK
jgi:hypothetical protein